MSKAVRKAIIPALSIFCISSVNLQQIAALASPSAKTQAIGSVANLKISVDCGDLAKTVHTKTIKKQANVFDDIPFMNGEPEHLEATFDNDKTNVDWQRKIVIYPIKQYAQLFKGRERAEFDKTIASLKSIISKGSANGVKALPMLPAIDCYEVFHNHAHLLDCKNGKGVAFIACYGQDEGPLSNGDFFYTYQGISTDGQYYISITYPVNAQKLKKNTPPKEGTKLISDLKENEFTPNLNNIDKMIESITFK